MAKAVSFPFYPDAFLSGTNALTFEERGKYITLLCYMYRSENIDSARMNELVGDLSETLKAKFVLDEKGLWHNRRMQRDAEKRRLMMSRRLEKVKVKSAQEKKDPMEALFEKWVEYRKSIRKPLKTMSLEGAFNRLKELSGNDPVKAESIIRFSIENGYQGMFPPKEYKQLQNTTEQWLA
jgi:uncharacterized protein YdaU (DUF1376 family)